jgi:hypothetical protein
MSMASIILWALRIRSTPATRRPIIGTETSSLVTDRGIYTNDTVNGYVWGYDLRTRGSAGARRRKRGGNITQPARGLPAASPGRV